MVQFTLKSKMYTSSLAKVGISSVCTRVKMEDIPPVCTRVKKADLYSVFTKFQEVNPILYESQDLINSEKIIGPVTHV